MVSRLVTPSFSLPNNLISAEAFSAVREGYKNTFSKVSFNISCNKNRIEIENIFVQKKAIVKNQKGTVKSQGR